MDRYEHKGAAATTTLSGDISAASTTINIADASGWPDGSVGEFFVSIARSLAGAEKVLIASRTGTSLTVASGGRGADDTTASAHSAGEFIEHVLSAVELDELNDHVTDTARDDHTQYHTAARHALVSHTTAMLADESVTKAKIETSQQLFAGAVQMAAFTTAPTGWLACDGAAVSRTTYADLFTAIGTTYGAGNGTTTFNVPDLRGRFPIGEGNSDDANITTRALGAEGGSETVTLSSSNLPGHTHSFSATSSSSGSHQHAIDGDSGNRIAVSFNGSTQGLMLETAPYTGSGISFSDTDSAGAHTHTVSGTSGSAGSGLAASIVNPFVTLAFFIKV